MGDDIAAAVGSGGPLKMPGYMLATGPCVGCNRIFHFNPARVPSITVNGTREPICEACFNLRQEHRKKQGLPAEKLMQGAYEAQEVEP